MDPFRNYDAWLEEPFQRMLAEQEDFYLLWETVCSENGWDPECDVEDHPDHHHFVQWLMWQSFDEDLYNLELERCREEETAYYLSEAECYGDQWKEYSAGHDPAHLGEIARDFMADRWAEEGGW